MCRNIPAAPLVRASPGDSPDCSQGVDRHLVAIHVLEWCAAVMQKCRHTHTVCYSCLFVVVILML